MPKTSFPSSLQQHAPLAALLLAALSSVAILAATLAVVSAAPSEEPPRRAAPAPGAYAALADPVPCL